MKWKYSFIVLLSALIACNNNTESKDSKEVNEKSRGEGNLKGKSVIGKMEVLLQIVILFYD